jgi:hypothetical protein
MRGRGEIHSWRDREERHISKSGRKEKEGKRRTRRTEDQDRGRATEGDSRMERSRERH